MSKLQAYDFDIEYVKGKHNVVAKALSRRPTTLSLMSITPDRRAQLLVEYSKDRFACEVLDGLVIDDWNWVKNKGDLLLRSDLLGTQLPTEREDSRLPTIHN